MPPEDPPLRLATAGSTEHGKSTLVGRLLRDAAGARSRGPLQAASPGSAKLAFTTDVLKAERQAGVTIEVAYRSFATPRRRFVVADVPGRASHTPKMVSGASTAHALLVVLDARAGLTSQTRRHAFLGSLLGITRIVVAVNKMDLASWSQATFEAVRSEYLAYSEHVGAESTTFVPMSALLGDNVVVPSERMPWYEGPTLLDHLESITAPRRYNLVDFRFPVQCVIHADDGYCGYAARIASGGIRTGQDVMVLPSGERTRILAVQGRDRALQEAHAGDSVALTTVHPVQIERGDMFVRPAQLPSVGTEIDAVIYWASEKRARSGAAYLLRQTTREVCATVSRFVYRIDANTLEREETDHLALNDVGRVRLSTDGPIFFDPYRVNRATGSFILIDPETHETVAAGMIHDGDD